MLLTLSTTHAPATDLGFLLMKHPDNLHAVDLGFGRATLFYPQADDARCTAALMVEVDPIEMVRGRGGVAGIEDQYVNDRPYAASSLLAVAISRSLGTAMGGRSRHRQELADGPLPFEVTVTPIRGTPDLVARLFSPLGYAVEADQTVLDPAHPEWGDSPYVTLRLAGDVRLADLLAHLTVLIPVLDNAKHYYLDDDEVQKLLRRGEGWLEAHPERELIVRRYLRFGSLMYAAHASFDEQVVAEPAEAVASRDVGEQAVEKPIRLNDQRMVRVVETLQALGAATVLDLGCGEGRLVRELLRHGQFRRIVGVEVAPRVLAGAADRLRLEEMSDLKRSRVELLQGSLVYRDDRLQGFDAAAVVEVIEHMDPERLPAFEAAVFGHARPNAVIVTTPNRDYNAVFAALPAGTMRHPDHRFEWSRAEFRHWAETVAAAHGYQLRIEGIGTEDASYGCPTQMGVFTR